MQGLGQEVTENTSFPPSLFSACLVQFFVQDAKNLERISPFLVTYVYLFVGYIRSSTAYMFYVLILAGLDCFPFCWPGKPLGTHRKGLRRQRGERGSEGFRCFLVLREGEPCGPWCQRPQRS